MTICTVRAELICVDRWMDRRDEGNRHFSQLYVNAPKMAHFDI